MQDHIEIFMLNTLKIKVARNYNENKKSCLAGCPGQISPTKLLVRLVRLVRFSVQASFIIHFYDLQKGHRNLLMMVHNFISGPLINVACTYGMFMVYGFEAFS